MKEVDPVPGEWWLPERPDGRVPGVLHLSSGPADLRVMYPLAGDSGVGDEETLSIVYGRGADGRQFTLVDSWLREAHHRYGDDEATQVWRPAAVLVGEHLDEGSLRFDRMLLRTANLEALADYPHVHLDDERDEENWLLRVSGTATRTEHLTGRLDNATVRLVSAPRHSGGGQETTVSCDVYFDVEPDDPSPWQDLIQGPARQLTNLTSFALTVPCAMGPVNLRSTGRREDRNPVWVELDVPFLTPPADLRPARFLASFERLLSASDAPDDLIDRWHALTEEVHPVPTLLLAPAAAPFIYTEHRFTTLMQAIEALHDAMFETFELLPGEHRARVEAVLASDLPDEHRPWLEAVVRHANSVPYKEKVERVLTEPPPLREIVDVGALAKEVVAVRHALSHGGLSREGVPEADRLHWLGEILRFAASWHLLARLLDRDGASERVARHRTFRHAVEALA